MLKTLKRRRIVNSISDLTLHIPSFPSHSHSLLRFFFNPLSNFRTLCFTQMEQRPEIQTGSVKLLGPDDWRNKSNLQNMSISELVSELRDTFIQSDFDVVEEALVSREAMLKAEIKEKKKEIQLLEEKCQMERLEKVSVDMELKRVKEKKCKQLVKNCGVVKGELGFGRCIVEGMKKRKVVDLEDEKVEEKRRVGEQRMNDGGGGSDNRLTCSSGAVQKNLATKLVEPKKEFVSSREFVANMNILDGLDSDSSSSSSSFDKFDMDISFKSNKKMKTNAS